MSPPPETARARASRANARKSTGPKSAAGKARVGRRNARRHGLTLPVLADPTLAPEVGALARAIEGSIAGVALDDRCRELACRIAEAQVDLARVRTARLPLVAAVDADIKASAALFREMERLDRYERRARSRHRAAVRAFDAAVTGLAKQS